MARRTALAACLVFSGLTALVYQIVWVRLLGFTFGTSTEAVSTVLAVFFGGLALGNLAAVARLVRVARPLRVYALLELGIGVYALASVPLLQRLEDVGLFVGAGLGPGALALVRVVGSAAVLLPPTLAMGATLPVVARGLVTDDATLGRWSAVLYAANTLGAVLGAYLCGFWMIPGLGLRRTVLVAALVNLAVAAAVLALAGGLRAAPLAPADEARRAAEETPAERLRRGAFLLFFGVSGFVAIGYEIVWSKVFGIVMEGTLYGFAAVLSAFLLGIALGSFFVAPRVDRIRDLPRAFGWLHAAIALSVLVGVRAVPDLPWWHERLGALGALDAVHRLFLLAAPLVLVPTALFGAAFPVLIRIYARHADAVGRGIGVASAVNTAGSILASLWIGFWWIPELGMDRTLWILTLLDGGVALAALACFQRERGWRALAGTAGCAAALAVALHAYDGVQVDRAISGESLRAGSLGEYRALRDRDLASQRFRAEGRAAVVTVYVMPTYRLLRTNGLPEAGYGIMPPYYPTDVLYLGLLPYLTAAEEPKRALLVGLGGGNTLDALLQTGLERIDVVELERAVVDAQPVFHSDRENPLDDPRVHVVANDGRNELRVAARDGRPRYDLIASQPSHPWRVGVANLFTEEYFRLARAVLADGGRFAVWINGFRIDPDSLLAIVASFERVFPGSLFFDVSHERERTDFVLLGGREPLVLDPAEMARRMREPRLAALFERYGIDGAEPVLAGFEAPAALLAARAAHDRNTDDDAFVETRAPRRSAQLAFDYAALEAGIDPATSALPPLVGPVDVARMVRALLDARPASGRFTLGPRIERLLGVDGGSLDPVVREALRSEARLRDPAAAAAQPDALAKLAAAHPERPEPWRVLGGWRRARGDLAGAAKAYAQAWERSHDASDAFEAGRAVAARDLDAAEAWFARIPADARAAYPELALYAARSAVERGAPAAELRRAYDALRAYRATRDGRVERGVDELLERLAWLLGDADAARGYADLARERRSADGQAAASNARRLLEAKRLDEADAWLAEAERLLPSDGTVLSLRAKLALARGDRDALGKALVRLREWAPSHEAAIANENRFREEAGLPLLPRLSAEALLAQPPPLPDPPTN